MPKSRSTSHEGCVKPRHSEFLLHELEQLLAAGMKYVGLQIAARKRMPGQKAVHQFPDPLANHLRHFLGKDDVKAAVAEIETHRI